MTLSVIVPAYEKLYEVLVCTNSLHAFQTMPVEWIISDDASPSLDFRAVIHPAQGQVVRRETNGGFAANCNHGAAHAHGDVLLFLNQDIIAVERSAGWDAAMLAAFDDPTVGIVGARLLFENGAIQSAGGLIDARGTPFHRCLGYANPEYHEVNESREVTWVTGAALAIRANLFRSLGGFDAYYAPSYFEDVDLCLKAREAGYKVWYQPGATFVHRVGTTGGSPHFQRSALRFKERWVNSGRLTADVPIMAARYW